MAHQLYGGLAREVLDVEAEGEHARQTVFKLSLQGLILVGVVPVAQQAGYGQLLLGVFHDVDVAEGYDTAEIGGVFLGLHLVLGNDAEGGLGAVSDGIDLMAAQGAVEIEVAVGIDVAEGDGIGIAAVAQQGQGAGRGLL